MDFEIFKRFLKEKKKNSSEVQEVISWIHSEEAKNTIEKELLGYKGDEDPEEDFDAIYNEILAKIRVLDTQQLAKDKSTGLQASSTAQKRISFGSIAVAAVLAIVLVSSYLIFIVSKQNESAIAGIDEAAQPIVKMAPKGQKLIISMSDGTRIKLNGGASISYYPQTYESDREVELEGEAFFDVFRDEAHPFEVKVKGGTHVTVLGTSFVIDASNPVEQVVAVKSGKVAVRKDANDQSIVIEKDELVKVSEFQTLNKKAITNRDLVFGWVENRLVLEDASFTEVLNKLNKWFGYEIEVGLDFTNYDEYSASLSNPTLKEVMESLAHSYKFNYQIDEENKKIEIR